MPRHAPDVTISGALHAKDHSRGVTRTSPDLTPLGRYSVRPSGPLLISPGMRAPRRSRVGVSEATGALQHFSRISHPGRGDDAGLPRRRAWSMEIASVMPVFVRRPLQRPEPVGVRSRGTLHEAA